MADKFLQLLPPEGIRILLTLFLCFLIGLQREEQRSSGPRYFFGGVRTFPLIGLIGYALTLLSGNQLLPFTMGFVVTGAFLWLSYRHKLETYNTAGATTEISGLVTYVIGALVAHDQFWIATTLTVLSILLLELKQFLENLTTRIPGEEILTFTKFLLLTFVILPVVPNKNFGPFDLNPFKTWLIVVAISGVSYGSYLLQKLLKGKGGVRLAAVLGGAYSSTFTTIAMAKRARGAEAPHTYSGAIVIASGIMYFRFLVLIGLFNRELMHRLLPAFSILGLIGVAGGWLWSSLAERADAKSEQDLLTKNPLAVGSAFVLAALFVAMMVAMRFATVYLGRGGIYGLAVLSGIAPVDPFIMGLTQTAGGHTPFSLAEAGIVIAAASNNFAKALFTIGFADAKTGREGMLLLLILTALGLLPLIWVVR